MITIANELPQHLRFETFSIFYNLIRVKSVTEEDRAYMPAQRSLILAAVEPGICRRYVLWSTAFSRKQFMGAEPCATRILTLRHDHDLLVLLH